MLGLEYYLMRRYAKTAISLVNARETALYFDHVIPVNLGIDLLELGYPKDGVRNSKVFPPGMGFELLPPELSSQDPFNSRLVAVNETVWLLLLKALTRSKGLPPKIGDLSPEEFDAIEANAAQSFYSFLDDFDLRSCVVDVPDLHLADTTFEVEDVAVTLTDLKLIDVGKTSWEHILEFRRSAEARVKLRRLRLFAFENYQGRDRASVEDDILQRLADYSQTIAEWGFETRHGAFTAFLSSKVLAGAITGSVVSSLLGQPLPAVISAVGGIVLELGTIALEIQKRGFQLRKLVRENPVTYIHDARKTLKAGPNKRLHRIADKSGSR